MGTGSWPADPVTAGAASIQSTTFANVAADYSLVSHEQAKAYLAGKLGIRYFPAKVTTGWNFLIRNDLTGTSANLRNLIGIHVQTFNSNHNAFSVANGQYLVPVSDIEIDVLNWYPIQRTLSDSSIITRFKASRAMICLSLDVENGNVYTDVGETRAFEEAGGFILLRAAASAPVLTPALKALAGLHPLA